MQNNKLKVAIVDYGSGNLKSVVSAFKMAARMASIDCNVFVTNDPDDIRNSDKIVLPGVGNYSDCYKKLSTIPNMLDSLDYAINTRLIHFLGICVGMQLLSSFSLEGKKSYGLNWIPGLVTRIPLSWNVRTPHMGWNQIKPTKLHFLFSTISSNEFNHNAYFVHSYVYNPLSLSNVLATTSFSKNITVAIHKRNIVGIQFHPEKSHNFGIMFCKNFLLWSEKFN
ncbi:Imidazole glycerol phosphate synthase subunit HisH 1 [Candidatus Hodgkinia cicadicola]|uniref:Imidazole glycerol phosphate synthase subunit HisH n=1 Tax=Candidatus Hodgkinia cicadicola TaxID=573658 RepID=A0ABX4MGF0_9HYPH|nr:Imidazole glycerol phosphate synthase subunit HisH 1 [Candidatus Hodgkinia cicadicola]